MSGLQVLDARAPLPPANCSDAIALHLRDWDWEAIRAGGKLHLFCYLRDGVIALAPFEFTD